MKIHVTDRHIERGVGRNPRACAVAIAIEEQVPTCQVAVLGGRLGVCFQEIGTEDWDVRTGVFIGLALSAQLFLRHFDKYKASEGVGWHEKAAKWKPKPLTFNLKVPERFLAKEPERTKPNEPITCQPLCQ